MKLVTALALLPTLLLAAPKPLFTSKVIDTNTPGLGVDMDVDIAGAKQLFLVVTDGGNGFACDWADWAEPRLVMADGKEKKLTEIEWKSASSGWQQARVNASAGGQTLRSNGKDIPYGIGTHATSIIEYVLPPHTMRFQARGALDEGGTRQSGTSVVFQVYTENPGQLKPSDSSSHEPEEAVPGFKVHPELAVQLFASEPMMLSPASIDIDARGRVWVCEVVNYRSHNGERKEGDRILIVEDTDHDGKADKSSVFYQGADVNSAHGICVLGNKALVSCGDDVFWLIDDNGDDKADRKELMFTKIGGAQHDHGIHAFHFGPDGRLYFNFGNAGKQLCDKDGNLITDIHGVKCTNQNNRPYQQGMVFRCELDGSNVEMLAWNFRNNWEVSVDSFGTMWQSDNDDDGNKGVRINYVMEFGNYGYSDEMTGAGWQTPRIGLEEDIPHRHWHQNDPGVIPNVVFTGAGSPTGILMYEGNLLPSIFKGQPIHCDAGPNVVRAYVAQPDGAGYKAETVNLIEGAKDRWFRPSDVCTAPDGSLIVADWYDPGVGGHGMGDTGRGRLFRVTVPGSEKYEVKSEKYDSMEGAVEALKSPNESVRYLAWTALKGFGAKAEPALKALFEDKKAEPQHRARALWLLARLDNDSKLLMGVLDYSSEVDPGLRIVALRAARQLASAQRLHDCCDIAITTLSHLRSRDKGKVSDAAASYEYRAALARETALAIRSMPKDQAGSLWQHVFDEMRAGDRWAIEALGIAADGKWNEYQDALAGWSDRFEALEKKDGNESWVKNLRDLQVNVLIRSRGANAPRDLARLALQPSRSASNLGVLRSLQLLQPAQGAAVSKAAMDIFLKADSETSLAATALLNRDAIAKEPAAKARLDELLKPVIGKPAFVDLVQRLSLTGFEKELMDYILANPSADESVTAGRLIAMNTYDTADLLAKSEAKDAKALAGVLGRVSDRASVNVLGSAFWKVKDHGVRVAMIEALALSGEGGRNILRWNKEGKLPEDLKAGAAIALSRSTDGGLRDQAAKELPVPAAMGAEQFPPLAELMKLNGDVAKGQTAFMTAGCVGCHQVKGQFINFGPDLSLIGGKLSKDGMFTAVLYPSAAIEHSFNGLTLTLKNGSQVVGYVISDTTDELTLKINGGAQQVVKKSDITKREEMKQSLMPPGLAAIVGPQGLADLVAWLQTLK